VKRARALSVGAVLVAALGSGACQKGAATDSPPAADAGALAAPTATAVASGGPLLPPVAGGGAVYDLVASANRKMMHDDGKGCLEDLDRVAEKDPAVGRSLWMTRAQCEMLVGHCQEAKKAIADYYVRDMAMSEERAKTMAESIAAMRCRGGDVTDRDRLLRALHELTDGAYINPHSAEDCEKNIALVKELAPKVPPRDPDDGQVRDGPKALFHTGAACLARAGDCKAAYRVWSENYPPKALTAIKDPALLQSTLEGGFRSAIERCKDADLK
jgi:hypothetical protein